jgi:hypothetical protein
MENHGDVFGLDELGVRLETVWEIGVLAQTKNPACLGGAGGVQKEIRISGS